MAVFRVQAREPAVLAVIDLGGLHLKTLSSDDRVTQVAGEALDALLLEEYFEVEVAVVPDSIKE